MHVIFMSHFARGIVFIARQILTALFGMAGFLYLYDFAGSIITTILTFVYIVTVVATEVDLIAQRAEDDEE